MTIENKTLLKERVDIFEVVNKIPAEYEVWNIGDNMNDGYLPLCQIQDDYKVNINTLKAIKLESQELELMREAAGYGVKNLSSAKRALNRKAPKGLVARRKKELAEKTITIFERLA